jgi:hypothetical protein
MSKTSNQNPPSAAAEDSKSVDRGCCRSVWAWGSAAAVTLAAGLALLFVPDRNGGLPGGPGGEGQGLSERVRQAELDPLKQKEVWDAEHITFRLENRFGKPLLEAVLAGKPADIVRHLRPGFRAQLPGKQPPRERNQAGIQEFLQVSSGIDGVEGDAESFASYMVDSLNRGGPIDSSRLQLLQIKQMEEMDRWWAEAFISIRGPGYIIEGVHECEFHLSGDTMPDQQPTLVRWRVIKESYRKADDELLHEVTSLAGLGQLPLPDNWKLKPGEGGQYQFQFAVEDFDRDGYLDIAIATYRGRPLLLRGVRGARFVDVTAQMSLKSWKSTGNKVNSLAGWIDVDGDSFPELVLGEYIYHNEGGRGFQDMTERTGVDFQREPMGLCVADYDCDGRLDFYVPYQMEVPGSHKGQTVPWIGDNQSGVVNALWHNEGNGQFRNVSQEAGASGGLGKSFAASWFFFDDDNFPDIYIANDFGANVMLRNRGDGTFEDVSEDSRASDYATSMGVASGDLDNDGTVELYVANMYSKMGRRIIGQVGDKDYPQGIFPQIKGSCAGSRLYHRKKGEAFFGEKSVALGVNTVGWAYGPAFVDIDSDGLLDLYATTGFMSFDRRKPDG